MSMSLSDFSDALRGGAKIGPKRRAVRTPRVKRLNPQKQRAIKVKGVKFSGAK